MKRRHFLQSPLQLSLFDFEPAPTPSKAVEVDPAPQQPAPSSIPDKPLPKKRHLPGGHDIEYVLRRTSRRSIGFLIEDDGLRVTAPRWVTIAEIEDAIRSKLRWIVRKLEERNQRQTKQLSHAMQWRDGASLSYIGKPITLRILSSAEKTHHSQP